MLSFQQQLDRFCNPKAATLYPKILGDLRRRLKNGQGGALNVGSLAEVAVAHHATQSGLRIVEVSEQEAALYAQTDLSGIDAQDWQQSYPLIIVSIPHLTDLLYGVLAIPELIIKNASFTHPNQGIRDGAVVAPVNIVSFPMQGVIDHMQVHKNIELGLTTILPDSSISENVIDRANGRIALNAVLHLSNYGDQYSRFTSRQNKVMIRRSDSKGQMKRMELLPQVIRIKPTYAPEKATQENSLSSRDHALHHRPHWRRGHWRRVAIGQGRGERRNVWIKPVLVNQHLVSGNTANTVYFND